MENIIQKGIKKICDTHIECVKLPQLKKFVMSNDDENE